MGLETQATGNCPVFPKQDVERLVNFLSSTYFGEISEDLLKRAKGFFYHVYVVKCKYHADMYESIAKQFPKQRLGQLEDNRRRICNTNTEYTPLDY